MKTIILNRRPPARSTNKHNAQYPRLIRITDATHRKMKVISTQTGIPLAELSDQFLTAACEEVQIKG